MFQLINELWITIVIDTIEEAQEYIKSNKDIVVVLAKWELSYGILYTNPMYIMNRWNKELTNKELI